MSETVYNPEEDAARKTQELRDKGLIAAENIARPSRKQPPPIRQQVPNFAPPPDRITKHEAEESVRAEARRKASEIKAATSEATPERSASDVSQDEADDIPVKGWRDAEWRENQRVKIGHDIARQKASLASSLHRVVDAVSIKIGGPTGVESSNIVPVTPSALVQFGSGKSEEELDEEFATNLANAKAVTKVALGAAYLEPSAGVAAAESGEVAGVAELVAAFLKSVEGETASTGEVAGVAKLVAKPTAERAATTVVAETVTEASAVGEPVVAGNAVVGEKETGQTEAVTEAEEVEPEEMSRFEEQYTRLNHEFNLLVQQKNPQILKHKLR
jgi:hypothetical protein